MMKKIINMSNPQLKKYYDQILEEEEKARDTIENALNEKYVKNNIIYNN